MPVTYHVAVAAVSGLFGLLLLVLLWPGEKQGARVLERWGVAEPTDAEVRDAVRYLRRRRFWYPWLFLGLPLLTEFADLDERLPQAWASIPVTLLLGVLLAELFAQRPVVVRGDEDVLEPRILDLAPLWCFAAYAVVALLSVLPALGWPTAAGFVVWTGVVALIVTLAAVRPTSAHERADTALRVRSARVAVGLGAAVVATAFAPTEGTMTPLVMCAGLATWVLITSPVRSSGLVRA